MNPTQQKNNFGNSTSFGSNSIGLASNKKTDTKRFLLEPGLTPPELHVKMKVQLTDPPSQEMPKDQHCLQ